MSKYFNEWFLVKDAQEWLFFFIIKILINIISHILIINYHSIVSKALKWAIQGQVYRIGCTMDLVMSQEQEVSFLNLYYYLDCNVFIWAIFFMQSWINVSTSWENENKCFNMNRKLNFSNPIAIFKFKQLEKFFMVSTIIWRCIILENVRKSSFSYSISIGIRVKILTKT